jgi:hypothetical protein
MSDPERTKLEADINQANGEARLYADLARQRGFSGPRHLDGTFAIHKDTGLLVATGPESFVDMVESIVTACQAKAHDRNSGSFMAPSSEPRK